MGGGIETVSRNDFGTNLGRQEEKDSYRRRENASEEVHGKVCLDSADAVIDGMTVGERCEVKGEKSKAAGPSDDGLKFGQFTRIVEARGNLLAGEIGKLSQNVRASFARGEVTKHQADGNTGSLDARFSTEDFRVAHDVLFPWHQHAPILSPFPCNGKRRAGGAGF